MRRRRRSAALTTAAAPTPPPSDNSVLKQAHKHVDSQQQRHFSVESWESRFVPKDLWFYIDHTGLERAWCWVLYANLNVERSGQKWSNVDSPASCSLSCQLCRWAGHCSNSCWQEAFLKNLFLYYLVLVLVKIVQNIIKPITEQELLSVPSQIHLESDSFESLRAIQGVCQCHAESILNLEETLCFRVF